MQDHLVQTSLGEEERAAQTAILEMQRSGTTQTRMLCKRTNKSAKGCTRGPCPGVCRDLILAVLISEIAICILVAEHAFDIQTVIER